MTTTTTALAPVATSDLFADDTWREWLLGRRSTRTSTEYAHDLTMVFSRYLAERHVGSWASLGVADVIGYPGWLRAQGYADSTQARRMSVARTAINYAYVLGLVDSRVATAAGMTKGAQTSDLSPRFPLDKAQVRALLAAIDTRTLKGQRDHAMLSFLLYLGLRSDELCSLTLGCFHRSGDYLVVQFTGKGRKTRELPVRPLLSESLRRYLASESRDADLLAVPADRADERLFRPYHVRRGEKKGVTNVAITTRGLRALVTHYASVAEVPSDVHTLRLTAATNAIEAGASLDQVQDLLGHSDVRTTRRYVKRHQSLQNSAAHLISY